jgi:hypothetical protein
LRLFVVRATVHYLSVDLQIEAIKLFINDGFEGGAHNDFLEVIYSV